MDEKRIIELCENIKNAIDWEYDTYSGYQKMMSDIENIANKIITMITK
jgi:hypothetical protein